MLLGNGTSGVFLAARVDGGGCYTMYSNGIYVWVLGQKAKGVIKYNLVLTSNFSK